MRVPRIRWSALAGGLVIVLAACSADVPTAVQPGAIEPQALDQASPQDEPAFLLGGLLGAGGGTGKVELVPVRTGARLTPDDAVLSVFNEALSGLITKEVDGNKYVSFKFGPSGLVFQRPALLSISVRKADLKDINPWDLRIAVASDDEDDWTIVGGIYNPLTRTVTVPVLHFSRYALCTR